MGIGSTGSAWDQSDESGWTKALRTLTLEASTREEAKFLADLHDCIFRGKPQPDMLLQLARRVFLGRSDKLLEQMRKGKTVMPGGILFGDDWDRLVASVDRVLARQAGDRPPVFVEIGVNDGRTSRDLVQHIRGKLSSGNPVAGMFDFYGIDPGPKPTWAHDDPDYIFIQDRSHQVITHHKEVEELIPDWVLVDGCHCAQCCIRDGILYGNMMAKGGELLFHDANPGTQGLDDQNYECMAGFHDEELARSRCIDVRRVLDAKLLAGFRLVQAATGIGRGGVEVYEKI